MSLYYGQLIKKQSQRSLIKRVDHGQTNKTIVHVLAVELNQDGVKVLQK